MNALTGLRVLVVEDEPIVAMCLEDQLEELGCITVGPAATLAAGLSLAEKAPIDAAILDINLAGERSDIIAELLRKRGIPFAFASGYGAAPEGFSVPLIGKPYRTDDIRATLQKIAK